MLRLLLKGISVLVNRGGPGVYNPWSPVQGAVSFTCLLVHGSILLVTMSSPPTLSEYSCELGSLNPNIQETCTGNYNCTYTA